MAAHVAAEEETKKNEKATELQQESENKEKRGLSSFGSYGSSSDWSPSFGDHYGGGHDHHHHHHHEHIKTVTIEKKVPVPYEVIKKIPVTVEKKVSS